MIVTLTQIYPPEKYLPDVRLCATFWAPHATDGAVDASSHRDSGAPLLRVDTIRFVSLIFLRRVADRATGKAKGIA
jgi:hypothetical protein